MIHTCSVGEFMAEKTHDLENNNSRAEKSLLELLFIDFIWLLIQLGYLLTYPFNFLRRVFTKIFNYISPRLKNLYKNTLLFVRQKQGKKPKKKKRKKAQSKKRTHKKKSKKKYKFHPAYGFVFGVLFSVAFILLPVQLYLWSRTIPSPELLETRGQNRSTQILDRNGRLLYELYVDKKYDPVSLDKIPDNVIDATIAIEDERFYEHKGVDFIGVFRAARANLRGEPLQGGSTITQQLVKNVLLTPERTLSRKLREVVVAVLVEREFEKDEILEMYLNNIPYGGTSYGIQSASEKFFNKDVNELTLGEASLLAGLPSAPTAYSPLGGDISLAKSRQKQVLDKMVELNYITQEEADIAWFEPLIFAEQVEYIRAPHFVEYVRSELYKKYGQRAVDFGGLTVQTTLDVELQEIVQQAVTSEVQNGERYKFSNGAAVVLDNDTGGILAYVGSKDYFGEDGKFDVVTAYRQPGSSIKPVTYAAALEAGFNAATPIRDTKVTYQSYGQTYTPQNYDGKYHGIVTIRQALANSYNIPAVKILDRVGIDNMVQLAIDMGLNYWSVGDGSYGLSITLGGKEVRLLDLANVYATFARGGEFKETTTFISVKDNYGYELYNISDNKSLRQVIEPETAYIISDILSDNVARTPAFGSRSKLVVPGHTVAVKTGTTNDIRDNYTVGYTPDYTVGVWVGNNDNTPMSRVASGVTGASPIWNSIFVQLLEDKDPKTFIRPVGIVTRSFEQCGGRTEMFDNSDPIPGTICFKQPDEDKDKEDKDRDD